jgi:hypothetical protein
LFFVFVIFVTIPIRAFAWGYDAHRIIAEIAEQFLQPRTAHQVRELLAIENVTTLAEVSTWADEIRPQHPETAHWHFVNIPIHASPGEPKEYDANRDCPHGDCVVAKIEEFERVLSDRQKCDRERLEALKYLVHFVGDLHQPLHAANDHDRGGNDVTVTFMGLPTNLHAVWDSGIIAPAVKGDERSYALQLVRQITPAKRRRWMRGDVIAWANESHRIAVRTVYGRLRHSGVLPKSYEDSALSIANEQLERAGVRLAVVLNDYLK